MKGNCPFLGMQYTGLLGLWKCVGRVVAKAILACVPLIVCPQGRGHALFFIFQSQPGTEQVFVCCLFLIKHFLTTNEQSGYVISSTDSAEFGVMPSRCSMLALQRGHAGEGG